MNYYLFLCLILIAGGLIVRLLAGKYKTAAYPAASGLNAKLLLPFLSAKSWFTPLGYKLQVVGTLMIVLGAVIYLARSIFKA